MSTDPILIRALTIAAFFVALTVGAGFAARFHDASATETRVHAGEVWR